MIKSFYIITLLLTLGFYIVPSGGYACGKNSVSTEKSSCSTEKPSKPCDKECCKNKQSKDNHDGCGGKCGHSNCTITAVSLSFILTNEIKLGRINFDFSTEKQKIYTPETITSTGFFSLWIIPKIS